MKRYFGAALLLLALVALFNACGGNSTSQSASAPDGKAIYDDNCLMCHGGDGKLGVGGAFDLSVSRLSDDESAMVIKNGRNAMRSFQNLSDAEVKAVVAYINTLRK